MKTWITAFLLIFSAISGFAQEYYELKKYTLSNEAQEKRLDDYLKNAYLPAAKKAGIQAIGVFKPVASDKENFGKVVFVLTPYPNLGLFEKLPSLLEKNAEYREKGKDYLEAAHDNAPYKRIEGTLMRSFSGSPRHKKPNLKSPAPERVYELRSYEGPTERRYLNKVAMFNKGGEIPIFNRLGFNPMFYGEVLAGKDQPNMIYMTTFENMKSRDEHWEAFRTDAEWGKLKADPNYQNNVSGRWTFLLFPTDYSDL
ncbi:NIPSNAP family protein [Ravibacter arvi]|uniref:NIPSNAP family protein n=1 Tax=Ravibacter arvi TaxID=2051041 RepID=A0ABP8LM57_9BACT